MAELLTVAVRSERADMNFFDLLLVFFSTLQRAGSFQGRGLGCKDQWAELLYAYGFSHTLLE